MSLSPHYKSDSETLTRFCIMSHCCPQSASSKKVPKKKNCPRNNESYISVPLKTILHHIKDPWNTNIKEQGYYFCHDPDCEVAYFREDGFVIKKSELRTALFSKKDNHGLICHCFGVSMEDAISNPEIKSFVILQTKIRNCSCETSNPSGRCCLKDFP